MTNNNPTISVIIPVFDQEKFIAAAIQSILDQTFKDFEIIIANDGSTDSTTKEINKFSDNRIKVFSFKKNKGISNALNNCILNGKGKYISLLSANDTYHPEKLEKQVDFLERNVKIAAVFSLANIIDQKGMPFSEKDHVYFSMFNQPNKNRFEWLNYLFFHGNCICHSSMIIFP